MNIARYINHAANHFKLDIEHYYKNMQILRIITGANSHETINHMTLDQVGEVFGVTRERVRQIEAKAIRKLRHPSIIGDLVIYEEEARNRNKLYDAFDF